MGGDERRKEYDDGRTGVTVQRREKRWDEKVPEALKHTPQWPLVQGYFALKDAHKQHTEKSEGGKIIRDDLYNPPPDEEMIPSRLLGDDYQMYDNTPQAAPYDPMEANKRALLMEALRRIGALPEGTTPSF